MKRTLIVQVAIFFVGGALFANCTKQNSETTNRMGDKEFAMNDCAKTLQRQHAEGCFNRVLHIPICDKTCVVVNKKIFHCGAKMEDPNPVEDTKKTLCNEKNTWNESGL
jgi:hypothetical protein